MVLVELWAAYYFLQRSTGMFMELKNHDSACSPCMSDNPQMQELLGNVSGAVEIICCSRTPRRSIT